MHLVPCRWSKHGFKYVQVDLKDHNKFFRNPNRVNGHGRQKEKRSSIGYQPAQRQMYNSTGMDMRRASETTYGDSFIRSKEEVVIVVINCL